MRILFDYLDEGHTVDTFLDQYDIDPDLVHGFLGPFETRLRRSKRLRREDPARP
ncbi:MAG: hypothetical protein ABEL04_10430 [Salinibacter sp.]|uniref:hypothetical protein n=1 Tax=Salinibacter sp. TaxID=2065818 RepID=UPI0035D4A368